MQLLEELRSENSLRDRKEEALRKRIMLESEQRESQLEASVKEMEGELKRLQQALRTEAERRQELQVQVRARIKRREVAYNRQRSSVRCFSSEPLLAADCFVSALSSVQDASMRLDSRTVCFIETKEGEGDLSRSTLLSRS